ncbi:site-specific integrase [Tuberibacillus sp. Marseille-P3662]|uniref:site-specific integrase n=1 Tax=Tuberibacillus sp. Marseille-P3662 TaxID=1965358 RepID=UPI000A1CB995|nr:site-specific integrase [Tuberibacillus sp. Marseille-P3662]
MNFVQPIRDPDKIEAVKHYLKSRSDRNYLLFVLGINTGLRVSDILTIKVGDVKGTHLRIREGKTKKQKMIRITPTLKREIKGYIEDKDDHEYIFKSRIGDNKPIGRSMTYKILRDAADAYNLVDIGTHTMRKTFGYHFYQKYKDVALLQELFNHSSPDITLRYIGVNQDVMDKALSKFRI